MGFRGGLRSPKPPPGALPLDTAGRLPSPRPLVPPIPPNPGYATADPVVLCVTTHSLITGAWQRNELIGCCETRTVGVKRVLNTCIGYSSEAVHTGVRETGVREVEFSSVQFVCCDY